MIHEPADLMTQFRGHCDDIELQAADKLIAHKANNSRVVIIEYGVRGTVRSTGVKYNNRLCSIIEIANRKSRTGEPIWIGSRPEPALTAHTR